MSEFSQRTTMLGLRANDVSFYYENDGSPFNYAGKVLSNDTGTYLTDSKGSVEYSNESLEKFVKSHSELNKYYSEMVDNLTINTPPGFKFSEYYGHFYTYEGGKRIPVLGVTTRSGVIFKTINVYISRKAFISSAELYMTVQHEFFHAYFFYHDSGFSIDQEHAIINQWEHEQYNIWNSKVGFLRPMPKLINSYGNYARAAGLGFMREYWRFGFKTINYFP